MSNSIHIINQSNTQQAHFYILETKSSHKYTSLSGERRRCRTSRRIYYSPPGLALSPPTWPFSSQRSTRTARWVFVSFKEWCRRIMDALFPSFSFLWTASHHTKSRLIRLIWFAFFLSFFFSWGAWTKLTGPRASLCFCKRNYTQVIVLDKLDYCANVKHLSELSHLLNFKFIMG